MFCVTILRCYLRHAEVLFQLPLRAGDISQIVTGLLHHVLWNDLINEQWLLMMCNHLLIFFDQYPSAVEMPTHCAGTPSST